jgi:hypothetical protein
MVLFKREELPFTIKSYEVLRAEAPAFLEPELLLQIDSIYEKFKRLNDTYYLNRSVTLYSFPKDEIQYLIAAIK